MENCTEAAVEVFQLGVGIIEERRGEEITGSAALSGKIGEIS